MWHRKPLVAFGAVLLLGTSLSGPRAGADEKRASDQPAEMKAVAVAADEQAATRQLNALAAEGWELVGPLGNGLVAFKRPALSPQQLAAKNELAKWQGEWSSGDETLIIQGDRWRWGKSGKFTLDEFKNNRIAIVDLQDGQVAADLFVDEGEHKGHTCKAILHVDGDTLRYCGSYAARPMGFDDGRGYAVVWTRAKR